MGEYFTTQGAEGLELVRWARERDPSTRIIILNPDGLRVGRDRAGGPLFDLIRSPTGRPGLPEACGAPPGGVPSPDPEARDRRILPSP